MPKQDAAALEHYLESQNATGWQMTQDTETVWELLPRAPGGGETVFVSYFEPEDLRRKLDEILSSEEVIAWRQNHAAHTAALQAYAQKWTDDPPPFPKIKQKEQPDR